MMLLASLVLAQSVFTYSDTSRDLRIQAKDGQGTMVASGYRFELRGNVSIDSKKEKFTLRAGKIVADVVSGPFTGGPNQLKSATASLGIRFEQVSATGRSVLTGSSATYTVQGVGGKLDAKGSVKIVNTNVVKKETLIATGSSVTALLDKGAKRGLKSATLTGPVKIELEQAGGEASRIVFTGRTLTLDGNTIRLSGNVKATGSSASRFGNLGNVDSVTVVLNDRGEMSSFKFRSGGGNSVTGVVGGPPRFGPGWADPLRR